MVGEGGSVGGYTVKAIAPGAVQVIGPGGARTLAPVFDPTPRTANSEIRPPTPGMPMPGMPMLPGSPLKVPGRPFMPGRPRFGDGASITPSRAPNRFDRELSELLCLAVMKAGTPA